MSEKVKYILKRNVSLREYLDLKFGLYMTGDENPYVMAEDDYHILENCDGNHEFDSDNERIKRFLDNEFIKVYEEGDKLSKYQILKCDNLCFPKINWMLTGKCNYNCLHCFNAKDNARLNNEFSYEEALKLIEEATYCGVHCWRITGGEPMLHPQFFEILDQIYKHDMTVLELNTNGFFINQEALDRFKEIGFDGLIKISYDGIGYHDWLRDHKGADEITLKALKLCVANGFRVMVQTNVHKKNLHTMVDTIKLMDEIGCQEIRLIRTSESPRWLRNGENLSLPLDEYYDQMLYIVKEFVKLDLKIEIDIWQTVAIYPDIKGFYLNPIRCLDGEFTMNRVVCPQNRQMVAIASDGNLFPCNQMSGYYELHNDLLGNCKKTPLKELLTKSRYIDEICQTVEDVYNHDSECHNCEFFEYCAGGCRAIALALSNDKLYRDPLKCLFFKKGYYEKYKEALKDYHDYSKIRYSRLLSDLIKALKKDEEKKVECEN